MTRVLAGLGFLLLASGVDPSVVAEGTPLPHAAVAGLSGVILVAALAMSLQAMSQERRLTHLDIEMHPTMRLD